MTAEQLLAYVDLATGWKLFPDPEDTADMCLEEYDEYCVWRERCLLRAAIYYPEAYAEATREPDPFIYGPDDLPF